MKDILIINTRKEIIENFLKIFLIHYYKVHIIKKRIKKIEKKTKKINTFHQNIKNIINEKKYKQIYLKNLKRKKIDDFVKKFIIHNNFQDLNDVIIPKCNLVVVNEKYSLQNNKKFIKYFLNKLKKLNSNNELHYLDNDLLYDFNILIDFIVFNYDSIFNHFF
jgi:hypothetical protein